jgi:hypothetical protein
VLSLLLEQAQSQMANDPARAEATLARLERTQSADPRVGTLRARLTPQPGGNTVVQSNSKDSVEQQLDKALAAERAREWLGTRGALARYLLVLRNEPNNARAKAGVKTSEAAAAQLLDQAIAGDELAQIERIQSEWEAAQPESLERQLRMRQWRARQNDADEQRANIASWLREAQNAMAAGQLTSPPGQSAADRFAAVLVLEPNNAEAQAGLKKIHQALITQAENAIASKRFEMADRLITQAQERGASERMLRAVRAKLADAQEQSAPPPTPVQDPEMLAKRSALLAEIDNAITQNALLEPPGQNAFDLLRQLQRLGPGADIAERVERLSGALKVQLTESVEQSDFENAANILSSLRSLGPDSSLNALRSQLIESVIADIRAKIDSGAVDAAERRLSLLKQIDSHHPEIPDLQLALVSAKGAG